MHMEESKQLDHAQWAPSSLGLIEKCPGFRNRPDQKSEAAEAGNRIHHALEKDDVYILTDKSEQHVAQKCKDFIDGIIAEKLPMMPCEDFREIRLAIDLGGDLKTFGTSDRLLIYNHDGIMFDYKSGWRFVAPAERNAQAWSYIIGAFEKFPQLDSITFYLLVPNRDEISYHIFTRADIPEMKLRLNTIIRRAINWTDALLSPQPELCEYCARQASCPALALKALQVAGAVADGLPVPAIMTVSPERPEDIPNLLRLAPLMEAWAEGVRKEALKANLEHGIEIAGFQRLERAIPRAVTSVFGAWKAIKDKGITLENFLAACSKVSVPQLEDLMADLAPKGQKGKAREALECSLRAADVLREEGHIFYLKEKKK